MRARRPWVIGGVALPAAALAGTTPAPGADTQEERALKAISRDTGVAVETLREERSETALTLGDLRTAHLMAAAARRSFEVVVAEFKGGKPWHQMARESGLALQQVLRPPRRPPTVKEGS